VPEATIEQPAGDRPGATCEVDDSRGGAGHGLDDIQEHADLALTVGDEPLVGRVGSDLIRLPQQ